MKSAKESTLRVIAGRLKGRAIAMVKSDTTRSTKAILKESFFNSLGTDVLDCLFIEVFAGTGSMGIEALSRGAKKAIFFEREAVAFKILRQNIANLGLLDSSECYLGDSFALLHTFLPNLAHDSRCSVVLYFDPPFSIRDGYDNIYENTFELIKNLPKDFGDLIALEHISDLKMPKSVGDFALLKTRRFGKSSISYFIKASD